MTELNEMINSDMGAQAMTRLLKEEGKYTEFLRYAKRGNKQKCLNLLDQMVAKHRKRLNEELGITGGEE
jgi:hypothetical protein